MNKLFLFIFSALIALSPIGTPLLRADKVDADIEADLIHQGIESYFPYFSITNLLKENRPKTDKILVKILRDRSSRKELILDWNEENPDLSDRIEYIKIRNGVRLVGYLGIVGGEEIIRPFTLFDDVGIRENALDSLAAIGSDKAIDFINEALLIYENKLPKSIAKIEQLTPESERYFDSIIQATDALSIITNTRAQKLVEQAFIRLKKLIPQGDRIDRLKEHCLKTVIFRRSRIDRLKKRLKALAEGKPDPEGAWIPETKPPDTDHKL